MNILILSCYTFSMINEGHNENQERNIELQVVFGIPREISRVKQTLYDLPRLKKLYGDVNGALNVLPDGISESSSDHDVVESVSAEFIDSMYEPFAVSIREQQAIIGVELQKLREISSFKIFDRYIVELTRYGTGGSYSSLDGKVWIKIWEGRTKASVISTLVHEIIHVGINDLIEKHLNDKTDEKHHWYKERLVDLIGEKYFPGMRRMQNLDREIIQTVDDIFRELFPDMEAIIKTLANINQEQDTSPYHQQS